MDIKEARRLAVLALIRARFDNNQAAFARAIQRPPDYVNRILRPVGDRYRKSIGEDMARHIEGALNLATDSLVSPLSDDEMLQAAEVRKPYRMVVDKAEELRHGLGEPLKLGHAVVTIGRAVSALAPARRKMIASAAATIIENGADGSEELAAALDDLGAGVQVVGLSMPQEASHSVATDDDWRDLRKRVMRLAEGRNASPTTKAAAAELLARIDRELQAEAGTSKSPKTRHVG